MSESPGQQVEDAERNGDQVAARVRPAEDDQGIEAVPAKSVKIMEEEEDEVVALDDEEYDEEEDVDAELELEGDEDEEVEGDADGENLFDETGESSTDMDEFLQANLAYIEDCQTDIDSLNHKANDEILKVERKYNKLKQPIYRTRNNYIQRIPNFWANVFSKHPQLRRVLTKDDVKCLKFCTNLQIDDFEDSRSGYSIKFQFAPNPYFNNSSVTKEYHMPWHESPSCDCTAIDWKPGKNLTLKSSSFFSWFCAQDDASSDDIAEIIREELWPNPLQNFSMRDVNLESASDDDSDEEAAAAGDAPVYVGDDTAEYISSEDDEVEEEEWKAQNRNVQGKEVPSGSKAGDFYVIDDDDDAEFEESLDDAPDVIKVQDDEEDNEFVDDLEEESNDLLAQPDNLAESSNDVLTNSEFVQQDVSSSNGEEAVSSTHGVAPVKPVEIDPNVTSSADAATSSGSNGRREIPAQENCVLNENDAITSTGDT